jgi:glycosyltransferase involved in cell wall biosynthesis
MMITDKESDDLSLAELHKTVVLVRYSASYYASGGLSAHLQGLNAALGSTLNLTTYQIYLDPSETLRLVIIHAREQAECVHGHPEAFKGKTVRLRIASELIDKLRFLKEKNASALMRPIRSIIRVLCSPRNRWLARCVPWIHAKIKLNDRVVDSIRDIIGEVKSHYPDKHIVYIDHCPYQPLVHARLKVATEAGAISAVVYHGGFEQADHRLMLEIAKRYRFGAVTLTGCPSPLRELIVDPKDEALALLQNGIDLMLFDPAKVDHGRFRSRIGVNPGCRILLVPARITYQKGIHDLIDALALLPSNILSQLMVVFAGQTNSHNYRRWLENKIKSHHALRAVSFLFIGNLDQVALRESYRDSDLVVLPSYTEGVPRVLIEAQAMGTPCVATDVGGTRDTVAEKGCVRLVKAKDVAAMAKAIEEVLNTPDLCIGNLEHTRQFLATKYGLGVLALRHGRFYRKLCGEGNGRIDSELTSP